MQYIDPGPRINESSQTMNTTRRFPAQSPNRGPEILANPLCANDGCKVWLKAQRHFLTGTGRQNREIYPAPATFAEGLYASQT